MECLGIDPRSGIDETNSSVRPLRLLKFSWSVRYSFTETTLVEIYVPTGVVPTEDEHLPTLPEFRKTSVSSSFQSWDYLYSLTLNKLQPNECYIRVRHCLTNGYVSGVVYENLYNLSILDFIPGSLSKFLRPEPS